MSLWAPWAPRAARGSGDGQGGGGRRQGVEDPDDVRLRVLGCAVVRGSVRRPSSSLRAPGLLIVPEHSLRVTLQDWPGAKGQRCRRLPKSTRSLVQDGGAGPSLWLRSALAGYPSEALLPCLCPALTQVPPPLPTCSVLCQVLSVPLPEDPSLGWPDLANKNTEHPGTLELQINELFLIPFVIVKKKETCLSEIQV